VISQAQWGDGIVAPLARLFPWMHNLIILNPIKVSPLVSQTQLPNIAMLQAKLHELYLQNAPASSLTHQK
jgi:hypothetical protein